MQVGWGAGGDGGLETGQKTSASKSLGIPLMITSSFLAQHLDSEPTF